MNRNSPLLAPEPSHVPNHTWQVAWLSLGNTRESLRRPFQVQRNTNFRTATRGKIRAPQIVSIWEVTPWLLLKGYASFPQAPSEEASLNNRDVRGILTLLPQMEWTPRCPDFKESWISLQWIECRLVFHLTKWKDVWIPCGDLIERRRSLPHLDWRPHIALTTREANGVQCFKSWRCLTLVENW